MQIYKLKSLFPNKTNVFGATIVSNTYSSEKKCWIIKFSSNVIRIGDYAFRWCPLLKSITIPDSVTSIGDDAFDGCTSLTSITIPDSVTSIGDYAFCGCTSLTSITIPDSVTSIGYSAFYNCSSLTSVTIGNSVTTIEGEAFYNCYSLIDIYMGKNVTNIGYNAFGGYEEEIYDEENDEYYWAEIPSRNVYITNLENWVDVEFGFDDMSDTCCYASSNPLHCGGKLYLNNVEVINLVIPNSVTIIKSFALYGCSTITGVTIPESVREIGYEAFYRCDNLKTVLCYPLTPPEWLENEYWGEGDIFSSNPTIYVAQSAIDEYNNSIWKSLNIEAA